MRSLTLDDILHPSTAADFLAHYAGINFLYIPGHPRKFESLFPWADLNHILATHRFGAKGIRMVKDGRAVSQDAFLRDGIVRATEMTELLRDGATVVLERADNMHPPLKTLAESLEGVFEVPVQMNMYAGWRITHGFDVHWDDHDVIVLQIAGRKHWKIYGVTEQFPVKNSVELGAKPPESDPVWDGFLEQGDVLYMPRGWWHVAYPVDEPTMHITIGVRNPTGLDLLRFVSEELERDVRMRIDLAASAGASARGAVLEGVAGAVSEAIRQPGLFERFMKLQRGMASPRPVLGLPWTATAQILPDSGATLLHRASLRPIEIENAGEAINIDFNGKTLTFAAAARPLFEDIARRREFTIDEFCAHFSAQYEAETLRAFLADLVRHGLITVAPAENLHRTHHAEQP
jgi:ribosomal protein L16 Arg81 hydroxylase